MFNSPNEPPKEQSCPNRLMGLYLFAHKVLKERVFQNPVLFINTIESDDEGRDRSPLSLHHLWNTAVTQTMYYGENVFPETDEDWDNENHLSNVYDRLEKEIKSRIIEIMGQKCALITPPKPQNEADAYYIAFFKNPVLSEMNSYRYFVLEKTEPTQKGDGVLCEWFADGSRCNHELFCCNEPEKFIQLICEVLSQEQKRIHGGAEPISSIRWDPHKEKISEDKAWDKIMSGFRQQHCIFSFIEMSNYLKEHHQEMLSFVKNNTHQEILKETWNQAGINAKELGYSDDIPCEGLSAEIVKITDEKECVLITLPEPFSPPEAYYIILIDSDNTSQEPKIYTLEKSSSQADDSSILGFIDFKGSHAVVGQLRNKGKNGFLDAVAKHWHGKQIDMHNGETLTHLVSYAAVGAKNK